MQNILESLSPYFARFAAATTTSLKQPLETVAMSEKDLYIFIQIRLMLIFTYPFLQPSVEGSKAYKGPYMHASLCRRLYTGVATAQAAGISS